MNTKLKLSTLIKAYDENRVVSEEEVLAKENLKKVYDRTRCKYEIPRLYVN